MRYLVWCVVLSGCSVYFGGVEVVVGAVKLSLLLRNTWKHEGEGVL